MSADEHLNTIQFADESGERPMSMTGKHITTVPINQIKEGMVHRPSWNPHTPFREAYGDAEPDPDHPATADGHTPTRIPYKNNTFTPHTDEDTPYHVVVRKKKTGLVAVRAPK